MLKLAFIAVIGLFSFLSGCQDEESAAGKYLKDREQGVETEPSEGIPPGGVGVPEPEPKTGDAVKGKAALDSCNSACHSSGIGKAVVLNTDAIGRLDTAIKGKHAGTHSSYKANFEQPGRADLEAAMKEVPK